MVLLPLGPDNHIMDVQPRQSGCQTFKVHPVVQETQVLLDLCVPTIVPIPDIFREFT